MMCVTSVDPYWLGKQCLLIERCTLLYLAELGGVFFSLRERNFDGLARAKANRDFSKKTELETEMARQREK